MTYSDSLLDRSQPRHEALALWLRAGAQAIGALQFDGRRLPDGIEAAAAQFALSGSSRAALQDIAYHTARHLGWAQAVARLLNQRAPAAPLAALQWVSLAQLSRERRAAAVVVDQAVDAARAMGGVPAARFLNATLRRFLRERDALEARLADDPVARWNHPAWWISQLQRDHRRDWQRILQADQRIAPMTLRVNRRRIDRDRYAERLQAEGIEATAIGPQALALSRSLDPQRLPGFAEGLCSVQDLAAQLAAPLLDAPAGARVLDACAAPGGKTAHLLELVDCEVVALDVDPERVERMARGLARLGLHAELRVGDAARPADWHDGRAFDRILLDAPCTASGIVRRHPDIAWLRRRGDLATAVGQQAELLEALWPLLAPDGKLLYATCSVFRSEGEEQIDRFLARHPRARRLGAVREGSVDRAFRGFEGSRWNEPPQWLGQLLPGSSMPGLDHDGFFYALLYKDPRHQDFRHEDPPIPIPS